MLILTRKVGEKVHIGDDICITVVDVAGSRIRIGIEAPKDVPISRDERRPVAEDVLPVLSL